MSEFHWTISCFVYTFIETVVVNIDYVHKTSNYVKPQIVPDVSFAIQNVFRVAYVREKSQSANSMLQQNAQQSSSLMLWYYNALAGSLMPQPSNALTVQCFGSPMLWQSNALVVQFSGSPLFLDSNVLAIAVHLVVQCFSQQFQCVSQQSNFLAAQCSCSLILEQPNVLAV